MSRDENKNIIVRKTMGGSNYLYVPVERCFIGSRKGEGLEREGLKKIFFLSEPKKHTVPPAVALMNLQKVLAEFYQTRLDSQCHLQLQ
jgi:hypothetical protein